MENEKIIKSRLAAPLTEIMKICKQEKIPFFFSAVASDDETKTKYFSEILTPMALGTEIADDKITKMMGVLNGFDVIPPREMLNIDF